MFRRILMAAGRYGILTSSGYHPKLITTFNQMQLATKGYMQSPNDWKNVKMTGYFKVNHFTSSTHNGAAHIELLARGGRNTNELPKQCKNMDIKDFSIREIHDPPIAAYSSFNTPAIYILTDILVVIVILMIYLAISKFKDYSLF
ncbi:MAG: hypothetical protein WBZ36_31260 [Candidatus Nitrosopolaris sp.]